MLRELSVEEKGLVSGGEDAITTMFNSSGSVTAGGTTNGWNWVYTGSTDRTFIDFDQNGSFDYVYNNSFQVMEGAIGDIFWRDAAERDMGIMAIMFDAQGHPNNDPEKVNKEIN